MHQFAGRLLAFLMLFTILIGCSVTHSVNTQSTKQLTKELKETTDSIRNVTFAFTRPNLFLDIALKEKPSKEMLDSMMAKVKAFATVDNMNEIAQSVNWHLEVSEIHLTIHADRDHQRIVHTYLARYFKTSDASDTSQENIDAYQTWFEATGTPDQ